MKVKFLQSVFQSPVQSPAKGALEFAPFSDCID